jgi:pyruvate carboxylase
MSGLTSQPNFNSVAAMMQGHERDLPINRASLNAYSNYWEDVRALYYPFESELKAGTAEVYDNEIPGGQYTNLRAQAESLGVGDKFDLLKQNYTEANALFGDIVKVTPSSKVVGDMAIFMTANGLSADDVVKKSELLSFPESVKGFFKGELGQPHGGFPEALQKGVLKGEKPLVGRPNDAIAPIDFDKDFAAFQEKFPDNQDAFLDYLSWKMYPKVYEDFYQSQQLYGNVSRIPTTAFFYGLAEDQEIMVNIAEGKTIIIRFNFASDPDEAGFRDVFFELNGQTRRIKVKDRKLKVEKPSHVKASGEGQIGSPLQGRLSRILVKVGDDVKRNTPLFVIEAMKMESIVAASNEGKISRIVLNEGTVLEQDDLVIVID